MAGLPSSQLLGAAGLSGASVKESEGTELEARAWEKESRGELRLHLQRSVRDTCLSGSYDALHNCQHSIALEQTTCTCTCTSKVPCAEITFRFDHFQMLQHEYHQTSDSIFMARTKS